MRHLAAATFTCALVAGAGASHAAKRLKVKAALSCAALADDNGRWVLGGKQKYRLERPVTCVVVPTSIAEGVEMTAVVWVSYATFDDDGKKLKKQGPRHAVPVAYSADRHVAATVTLTPAGGDTGDAAGPDFEACLDFIVHAEIRGPQDVLAWKGKLAVKQDCPD